MSEENRTNAPEEELTQEDINSLKKIRMDKLEELKAKGKNPFEITKYDVTASCADCGKKLYLCRATTMTEDQEHLKCSTHSADKDRCSAHYIRTVVLKELVLNALNKLLDNVKDNEAEFVQTAMDNSASKHSSDVFKAKKALNQAEKRIAELDRLFARLYEDNISGKISDERFAVLSAGYEDEQKKLKA